MSSRLPTPLPATFCLLFALSTVPSLSAQTKASITPSKDNSMFQDQAGNSNGAGPLFAGRTKRFGLRRAVLHFDVAGSLPAGAQIVSAQLDVQVNKVAISSSQAFFLHRVTSDWGEGTSNVQFGTGAAATTNDTTWSHRFWQSQTWATPGGDFVSQASSTTNIAGVGGYSFPTSAALVSDVQSWLDQPNNNFGVLLLGAESVLGSAKRIASREDPTATNRPTLVVTYRTLPKASVTPTGAGCKANNVSLDHGVNGVPTLGNTTYALQGKGGPASGIALLFMTLTQFPAPIPLNANGCNLYVDITTTLLSVPAGFDASGAVSIPFGIPNNQAFAGIRVETQLMSFDVNFVLRSSNALTHALGI